MMTLNLEWVADLGNGDAALLEARDPERCLAGMRALYELTPDGRLQERSPILYPAGTL